jgi:hypothetical protein
MKARLPHGDHNLVLIVHFYILSPVRLELSSALQNPEIQSNRLSEP